MILKTLKTNVINKHKLNADQLVILELIFYKDIEELNSYKDTALNIHLLIQNMYRRGFINFYNDIKDYGNFDNLFVTVKGEKVLEDINIIFKTALSNNVEIITNIEQSFEEWWNLYPSTDKWGSFIATRALRQNKEGCRKKFRELLKKYKAEDIIKALKYQIELFKNTSKPGSNKMTYLQNSYAYLNQEIFIGYLDAMKDEIEDKSMEIKL